MGHDTLEIVCYVSYRILIPAVLAVSAALRISIVSLAWLMFFLAVPCLPKFSFRNWSTHKSLKIFLILLLVASTLACCGHVVFWALQLTNKLNVTVDTLCNSTTIMLMNIGYQSLGTDIVPDALDRVRLIMPDFIVFIVTTVTTILCFNSPPATTETRERVNMTKVWRTLEPFITSICLFVAGSVAPSLISGVYFFTFMVVSTLWAVGYRFGKLPHLKLMLLVLVGLQIITLYVYQFREVHTHLPPDTLTARLLGFVQYYTRDCKVSNSKIISNPLHLEFTDNLIWGNYAFIFAITALYFSLGLSARYFIKGTSDRLGLRVLNPRIKSQIKRHYSVRESVVGNVATAVAPSLVAVPESAADIVLKNTVNRDIEISSVSTVCRIDSEERQNLLGSDNRGRGNQTYNTIAVDGVLEDAAEIRGSVRSRHSSFASSYHPEDEGTLYQIIRFITNLLIDQVYLLTLAVLMLWSITYISWMEFVLLVLVCFLCICPKAKEASYSVAYPLVGYGTILVIIQFIYGLDLSDKELAPKLDIGLKKDPTGERGKPVFIKTLFLTVFWLHLRAYIYQQINSTEGSSGPALRQNRYTITIYKMYRNVRHVIMTYWPVVCYVTLVLASLHSRGINIMRIIYLVFFAVFMFFYVTARKPLQIRILWLWYLLITYSMICVILMYTFQFQQIQDIWTDDVKTIADIGLSKSGSSSQLFTQLFVPILVLLAVTIQLRVFRAPPASEEEDNFEVEEAQEEEELEADEAATQMEERKRSRLKSHTYMTNIAYNVADQMKEFWSESKTFAARSFHISLAILEMHSPKFVSLAIIYVCVWRVSVINVVLLLVTVVTLPWPLVQYKLTIPIFCWVCWEIFSQLTYQLYVMETIFNDHLKRFIIIPCDATVEPFSCGFKNKSDIEWLGYYVMNPNRTDPDVATSLDLDDSPWRLVWAYLLVIVLLVIQRLLVHYMKGRRSPHVYILREGVFPDFIFPHIDRESAETTISLQLMYLCNNFFVLFGKEIVYICHVMVAAVRYDVYGFIYIVMLGIWKNMSSTTKKKMCWSYIMFINLLIGLQYFLLIGLPPGLCLEYPWCSLQKRLSLLIWLYLPTTPASTNQYFIFADFILLLCLTRLWHVFQLQKLDPTLAGALDESPGPDYADPRNKSTLNSIKLFIFTYLWWVTAAVLFINAVMTISIFSAGFLLATFSLLWYGSSLLIRDKAYLLHKWEMVIIYAYIVVLLKILLQIPSCMTFLDITTNKARKRLLCPIADVFKLICLQNRPEGHRDSPFNECEWGTDQSTGLVMDAITFTFLLIQIRVFKSPYFKHAAHYLRVLIETAAQGAMIMKNRVALRTKMNFEAEEKRLKHIKQHVAKLKAEHDQKQDFDFGTKELIQEATSYWAERERKEQKQALLKTSLSMLHEDLDSEVLSGTETDDEGGDPLREEEVAVSENSGGGGGGGGGDPDRPATSSIATTAESGQGSWLHGEHSEIATEPRDPNTWTPKPPKPDKPTEEIIVDVLEFSHQSLVNFVDFTIRWLDDKSGDYRFTSTAIFKERYHVLNNGDPGSSPTALSKSTEEDILEEVPPSSPENEHLVLRLATAIYYFCLARTELLCFLFMLLNHVINASLISSFYPLIAFLWGMIAFPRPSGIFWYIVIVYCKVTIIIKYLFQFRSIEWNTPSGSQSSDPMWAPNLLGLTKRDELILTTMWDLFVLMSVFFHKSCLETAGIWSLWYNTFDDLKDEEIERIITLPNASAMAKSLYDYIKVSASMGSLKDVEESPSEVKSNTRETSLVGDDVDGITEYPAASEDLEIRSTDSELHEYVNDTVDFTMLAKLNFIMFWKLLIDKTKKDMPTDLYLPMLLSAFLALVVTILGWSAFGKVEGQNKLDVSELISTNYIPSVFLIILLVQFMMMIIDRVIYLKKSMIVKYLWQILVVLIVHAYLFVFQPWFTRESFRSMAAWIAWYIFFCCYFTISAFQIQAGYPRLSSDSIVLRTYGYITYGIYLGYLAVPFLWELEVLLNWVCTETTLTLDYWVKYSDIKTYLFKLKCWQVNYEKAYYLGEKQPAYMKYGIGGLLVLGLIVIIWFPLLFMSVITTNSVPNPSVGFTSSLSITGLEPLVKVKVAQMPDGLTEDELSLLKQKVKAGIPANNTNYYSNYTEFIEKFKATDIVKLDIYSDSTTLWEISPAAVNHLETVLEKGSNKPGFNLTIRFEWSLLRDPDSTTADKIVTGFTDIEVLSASDPAKKTESSYVIREDLLSILKNCNTQTKVLKVNGLIPTFLQAKESGSSISVELFPNTMVNGKLIKDPRNVKNMDLRLQHESTGTEPAKCRVWDGYYWSMNQTSEFITPFHNPVTLSPTPNRVQFYIFSDRIVSSQYQLIASYGIIGLYISVVLVIFKFVRLALADSSTRIIFQEMPCPDLIMTLVTSTEMVRAQGEFVLEQVLFRKLLLLYRSPETLIVWTGRHRRLKEE